MSSEMLPADKYLSIVNDRKSLLRFLESRVNRKVQARFGGGRLETQVMLCAGRLPDYPQAGLQFMALDGAPLFQFTPAVSFFVNCETEAEVDKLWGELSNGGAVAMPLQAYPFSQKFGWIQDKYGLSWQLNLAGSPQTITPFLMFVGSEGQAETAVYNTSAA